jgi:hypothetical protein
MNPPGSSNYLYVHRSEAELIALAAQLKAQTLARLIEMAEKKQA